MLREHSIFELENVFYCKYCRGHQVAFETQEHLRIHMNSMHQLYVIRNWKLCKFCIDERFETVTELRKHVHM